VTTSDDEQVNIEGTCDESVNEQRKDGDGLTYTRDTGKQGNCNILFWSFSASSVCFDCLLTVFFQ